MVYVTLVPYVTSGVLGHAWGLCTEIALHDFGTPCKKKKEGGFGLPKVDLNKCWPDFHRCRPPDDIAIRHVWFHTLRLVCPGIHGAYVLKLHYMILARLA